MPKHDLGEILRDHIEEYEKRYGLSAEQRKAARAIMACRTREMGGMIVACDHCGRWEFRYKSCRNRHCPQCGAWEKAKWLERQKVWVLPVGYYQVVFTIDHVLNRLVWQNQAEMYNLVIREAAKKIKEYGKKYLGGELGFSLVLHTWGQQMQRHVHVHFMVTGGALVKKRDGSYRWQAAKKKYLFPVKLLAAEYREAVLAGVRELARAGKLKGYEEGEVERLIEEAKQKDWEVYIQPPQGEGERLLDYLGRYVHRIAMSNHRIVGYDGEEVRYEYYDNRDGGKKKEKTVGALEFIGAFLMHVLPRRFVRIRHYGLHHGSCREKLKAARELLGVGAALPEVRELRLGEWLREVMGEEADPLRCRACGKGRMVVVREFGPLGKWRERVGKVLALFVRWRAGAWGWA